MKYYICITPFFPSARVWQGAYILDQVKAIERVSDYKVIVLKPVPWYGNANDYEYDNIKVYCFRDYTIPSNSWPNRLCDYITSMSLIHKLKSIGIEINDIAVAHAHVTKQGAYVNHLKRKNLNIITIVQHHGFDVMSVTDGRFAKYKFHERQCVRHGVRICNEVDVNVGVSHKTLDYVLQQPIIHLKNQYVLYNGVDKSIFYPKDGVKDKSRFTIGCVANFWPLKDQMTLIKAVEVLRDEGISNLKCIFVGSGVTLQSCKQYVINHNLTNICEFRKEVHHNKLPNFYRSLNLFVLPSYWEAFGCVYTEAYACGVPFVGVSGQGIAEIISEEEMHKWLINKGDYNHLADIISELMLSLNTEMRLSSAIDIDELIKKFLTYILCNL